LLGGMGKGVHAVKRVSTCRKGGTGIGGGRKNGKHHHGIKRGDGKEIKRRQKKQGKEMKKNKGGKRCSKEKKGGGRRVLINSAKRCVRGLKKKKKLEQ